MRIAVINWTGRLAGGAETYLSVVLPALERAGHEVYFWHERDEPADRSPVSVARPTSSPLHVGTDAALSSLREWRPDVLFMNGLTDSSLEERLLSIAPSVFIAHNYYGTCISGAKTLTVPTPQPCTKVFGRSCLTQFYPRRCGGLSPVTMIRDYRRQQHRLANLRRCRGLVTLSEHMRAEYLRHGFAPEAVHRLPPPQDTSTTTEGGEADARPRKNDDGTTRLAFMGRLDRLKGCRLLIEALASVQASIDRPIELSIAGAGPDLAETTALAERVMAANPRVRIQCLGWISSGSTRELLTRIDALVVPSVWPEPLGLVGLDAIRQGVPVAAFRVGGIPEWLIDGQNGALAPGDPPTAAGLAAAIVRCIDSPRPARAASSVTHFSISADEHVRRLVEVFDSCIAPSPATAPIPA